MSGNHNHMNGDWRQYNSPDVYFSDEEVWMLSQIDAEQHPGEIRMTLNICEQEMRCQRDMKVRGRRLCDYHRRLGDLWDILDMPQTATAPGVVWIPA